jgi:hypothetical protein
VRHSCLSSAAARLESHGALKKRVYIPAHASTLREGHVGRSCLTSAAARLESRASVVVLCTTKASTLSAAARLESRAHGTQFTCFTGTKELALRQGGLLDVHIHIYIYTYIHIYIYIRTHTHKYIYI